MRLVADQVVPQLLRDYHAAAPGSRAFKTRLIKIVAISIRQIAVVLYNLGLHLGNHQDWVAWTAPTSDTVTYRRHPDGKLASLSYHNQYREHNQYPKELPIWWDTGVSRRYLETLCFSTDAALTSVSLTKTLVHFLHILSSNH